MRLTGIDLVLWAAGFLVHVILLAVVMTKSRARSFPIFTTLIAANIIRTLALYLAVVSHANWHTYLITYSAFAILDLTLQLGVVYEMASHVFRPTGTWAPDVRVSFLWIVGLSIAIAIGLALLAKPPVARTWILTQLIRGNLFSAALMSELFVGMIVLSLTVRLPWRTHVARISQGLGFYSILCILIEAGHSYLGLDHEARLSSILSYTRINAYLVVTGYWIVTLWQSAPAPRELPEQLQMQLHGMHKKMELDLMRLRSWRRS